MEYHEVLAAKAKSAPIAGFKCRTEREWLFPVQQHAVRWALSGGRRALFMDTGMGKSRMQLAWADSVCTNTGGRVLALAPLAVGPQTVREADRVGLAGVRFARNPSDAAGDRIVVTNYDNAEKFDPADFSGVVLDESSILKSFTGATTASLISSFRSTPYKLACTATPAPNDFTEFGTHAEFLGICTRSEMLSRYFVNDLSDTKKWRLKGHAITPFWEWVSSWAICAGKPSDLGDFSDDGYILPPLEMHRHIVNVDIRDGAGAGMLFRSGALSATGMHAEKRRTTPDRAAYVARLIAEEPDEPWLIWCDTQYEADALTAAIPHAVEVSGSMSQEVKADRLLGFADRGGVLITKPKIAGFGMNWQHCARVVFAGGSYSYEAFYQAIRRCWRFGQIRPVQAHVVLAQTEQSIWSVVSAKSDDHAEMKARMFEASRSQQLRDVRMNGYNPTHRGRIPAWVFSHPKEG